MTVDAAHAPTDPRLRAFAWMWSAAIIFHLGKWGKWLTSPLDFLLLVACGALLVSPASLPRLGLVAGLGAASVLHQLPWVSNHEVVMGLVSMTILGALWAERRRSGDRRPPGDRVIARLAPVIRVEILLLYGFAVFHKLNSDWFAPEVSCAVVLLDRFRSIAGVIPDAAWTRWLAIGGGIGIEGLLLVLLAIPRLRLAGILVGATFHLLLGTIGFLRFSALMYASYVVFLPDRALDAITGPIDRTLEALRRTHPVALWWQRRLTRWPRAPAALALALVAALLACAILFGRSPTLMLELPHVVSNGVRLPWTALLVQGVWLVWSLGMLGLLLGLLLGHARAPSTPTGPDSADAPGSRVGWLAVFPCILLLNGMAPYAGWKSESSFSMFSNLRTVGARANHLLLGAMPAPAGHANDLVTILASSDPGLERVGREGFQLPAMELASYLEQRKRRGEDLSLAWEWRGERGELGSLQAQPAPFPPMPWIARKFLWSRGVDTAEKSRCTH